MTIVVAGCTNRAPPTAPAAAVNPHEPVTVTSPADARLSELSIRITAMEQEMAQLHSELSELRRRTRDPALPTTTTLPADTTTMPARVPAP